MLTDSRSRLASPARRSPMKVSKLSEVPRQSMSRATKFFHGAEHVSRQGLTDESKEVSVNIIHFDHGAHTRMHIHGSDQVLLVTKGKGFVETEQERGNRIGIGLASGSGRTGVWLAHKGVRIIDGVDITGQMLQAILKLT